MKFIFWLGLSLIFCMPALAELSTSIQFDQQGFGAKVLGVRDVESGSVSGSTVAFRVGLIGGFGVEYIKDINHRWQAAVHASSWLLFSEAGIDIRYFFKGSSDEGFYIGSGVRILNSPLIFTLGLGPNLEFGYEKREASGLYYGVGLGATVLYIPNRVSAEGHGFEGVLAGVAFRVGKSFSK